MKKIEGLSPEEKKMLVDVLENSPTKGQTTIKDVRQIDKICKVVESSGGDVEMEDADHDYLLSRIKNFGGWMATGKARSIIIPLAEKLGL